MADLKYPLEAALQAMIAARQAPPDSAYLAQGLSKGIDTYKTTRQQAIENALKQKELEMKYKDIPAIPTEGQYIAGYYQNGRPMYRSLKDLISIDQYNNKAINLSQGGKEVTGKIGAAQVSNQQLTPGEREQSKASAGLVTPGEAGRYVLSNQAIVNIGEVKNILFPSGKPESFRNDIALKSKLPILGRPMPFDKDAQNVYRNLSDALSGKILIQTGVAARPEEVKAEYNKFYTNYLSNPEAAMEGFNKLEQFYTSFNKLLQTKNPEDLKMIHSLANDIDKKPLTKSETNSPITQINKKTGQKRQSFDGGATWKIIQ